MNKIVSYSILSLFVGILIGLAGGYFLAEYNHIKITSHSENRFALEKHDKTKKDYNNPEVNAKIIKKAKEEVVSEINEIENRIPKIAEDKITEEDSIYFTNENSADSNLKVVFQNEDEIVIRQEKLLHTASSYIFKISDTLKIKETKIDSNNQAILEKNADIKTPTAKEHIIEYWETPLNYKGYKYGNYKLIVYGFETNDLAILIQHNNTLYFRYKSDYYLIKQTNTFTPLKKVNVDFNDTYLEKL